MLNKEKKVFEIGCGICADLIPLVRDQVAGEESQLAVANHIAKCEECALLYENFKEEQEKDQTMVAENDRRMIRRLKRRLIAPFGAALLIVIVFAIGNYLAAMLNLTMLYQTLFLLGIGAAAAWTMGEGRRTLEVYVLGVFMVFQIAVLSVNAAIGGAGMEWLPGSGIEWKIALVLVVPIQNALLMLLHMEIGGAVGNYIKKRFGKGVPPIGDASENS